MGLFNVAYRYQCVISLFCRGCRLGILFVLLLIISRFLSPVLQASLVEADRLPAFNLQLFRVGLLVPVLTVYMVSPTAFDSLPQSFDHCAVLRNARIVTVITGVDAAVYIIVVYANAAAVRSSGGCKIPHHIVCAQYFGRTLSSLLCLKCFQG